MGINLPRVGQALGADPSTLSSAEVRRLTDAAKNGELPELGAGKFTRAYDADGWVVKRHTFEERASPPKEHVLESVRQTARLTNRLAEDERFRGAFGDSVPPIRFTEDGWMIEAKVDGLEYGDLNAEARKVAAADGFAAHELAREILRKDRDLDSVDIDGLQNARFHPDGQLAGIFDPVVPWMTWQLHTYSR